MVRTDREDEEGGENVMLSGLTEKMRKGRECHVVRTDREDEEGGENVMWSGLTERMREE